MTSIPQPSPDTYAAAIERAEQAEQLAADRLHALAAVRRGGVAAGRSRAQHPGQRRRSGGVVGSEALEQLVEVGPGELPLERGGDVLVVVLEGQQPSFYSVTLPKSFGVRILRWMTEK
jgi:hypothetical protein